MARKPAELRGVTDAAAISLYGGALEMLRARGQDNAATRAQLAYAAQWTQEANACAREMLRLRGREDEDGKTAARIRGQMRNKSLAEGEARKILGGLLLLPQRPRGRPPQESAETPEEDGDGGWDAFDGEGDGEP